LKPGVRSLHLGPRFETAFAVRVTEQPEQAIEICTG
jgi:hypothetical protein